MDKNAKIMIDIEIEHIRKVEGYPIVGYCPHCNGVVIRVNHIGYFDDFIIGCGKCGKTIPIGRIVWSKLKD